MTNLINTDDLEPIVTDLKVDDYLAPPRRPYDFNRGDRRFFDLQAAIRYAEDLAFDTGIRRVVRPDVPVTGHDTVFVVQEVGS